VLQSNTLLTLLPVLAQLRTADHRVHSKAPVRFETAAELCTQSETRLS
jgi:hypothetical protein